MICALKKWLKKKLDDLTGDKSKPDTTKPDANKPDTTTKPDANKPDSGSGDAAVGTGGGAAGSKLTKDKKNKKDKDSKNTDIDVRTGRARGLTRGPWAWLVQYGPHAQRGDDISDIVYEKALMEGGAMPGVGAIHIEEINPTLEQLEKGLGIDLKDFVLGSVGKREFSGDIDVALNLQPEEIPEFVAKLKNNPLIYDIAKSSVIMTKVKIVNYDESKKDGRPRTGFVQLDFMLGDPGWLKTYYQLVIKNPNTGVSNIMVATMPLYTIDKIAQNKQKMDVH